jgi:uncharacterized Rmd1/YagE family protein
VSSSARGTPLTTVALDGRVDLAAAASRLRWPELRRYPYGSVYALEGGARLYLFALGAVVHEGSATIDEPVRAVLESGTGRRYIPPTAETYYLTVDPTREPSAPRVGWDQVSIQENAPELAAAVALLLGQSAALERYEHAAGSLLDEAHQLARELAASGHLPRTARRLVQKVGRITADRLELARWFYLVDRPAETWEDQRVATLYDALFANLELAQRHQAMLHKLEAVEQATQTVIDLWQGRRAAALELAIVGLIVLEIALAVFKIV